MPQSRRECAPDPAPGLVPGGRVDQADRDDQGQDEPVEYGSCAKVTPGLRAESGELPRPRPRGGGLGFGLVVGVGRPVVGVVDGQDVQEPGHHRVDRADLDELAEPGVQPVERRSATARPGIPRGSGRARPSGSVAWIRAGSVGEPDEELAEEAEPELLGVLQRVDPAPVDDMALAQGQPHDIQAEDADRVEDPLAGPALVEVAQARDEPGQERRRSGLRRGIEVRVIVRIIVPWTAAQTHNAPASPIEISIRPRTFASPAGAGVRG